MSTPDGAREVGSRSAADPSTDMTSQPAGAVTAARATNSEMSTEQIEIFARTVSDVAGALEEAPDKLADRIRDQQEDVAETRRQAQVNEDLLRLRVR
jgi:hypothetical protein